MVNHVMESKERDAINEHAVDVLILRITNMSHPFFVYYLD